MSEMSANTGDDDLHDPPTLAQSTSPPPQSPLLNDESSPPLRTQGSNQEVTEEVLERTTQETTQEDSQENLLQNAQPAEIAESTPQAAPPNTQESGTEAREGDTQDYIQRDLYEDLNESLSESGAESGASLHEQTPAGTMGTAQESTQVLVEEPPQPRPTEQLETTNPHKKTRKQKYFSGRTVSLRLSHAAFSWLLSWILRFWDTPQVKGSPMAIFGLSIKVIAAILSGSTAAYIW